MQQDAGRPEQLGERKKSWPEMQIEKRQTVLTGGVH